MFGTYPHHFKNKEAVEKIVEGYQLEENTDWVVVYKRPVFNNIYKPCRISDLAEAKKQGWIVY